MDTFQVTWIPTNTRTGSTWTTSIVREILGVERINVLPKRLLRDPAETMSIYRKKVANDKNENNHYVLPTHNLVRYHLPRSRYITNMRNPFEICASYYEFMNLHSETINLEAAIEAALGLPRFIKYYSRLTYNKEKCFILNFDHIEEQPENLIEKLSKFLGVVVDEKTVEKLGKKYSKENLREIINENDKNLAEKLVNGEEINSEEIIVRQIDDVRSFDIDTGYQSGTISTRGKGEWRTIFSRSQIKRIIEALNDVAIEMGYESEI